MLASCAAPCRPPAARSTTRPIVDFPIDMKPLHLGFSVFGCAAKKSWLADEWRSERERKNVFACGEQQGARHLGGNDAYRPRNRDPALGGRRHRDRDAGRTTGLRAGAMPLGRLVVLMMAR